LVIGASWPDQRLWKAAMASPALAATTDEPWPCASVLIAVTVPLRSSQCWAISNSFSSSASGQL
jgi:hypothetical protein